MLHWDHMMIQSLINDTLLEGCMKVAVIGSRNLIVKDLSKYLPIDTEEIVSGGAKGVDLCAREYARKKNIKLTEFCQNIINITVMLRFNVILKS